MKMSGLRQKGWLVFAVVAIGTPGMFVCAGESPETAKPVVEQVEVIVGEALVRKGKQVVARVAKGTTLKVLEKEGRWYGVAVEVDGKEEKGWLHEKMVRPLPKSGGESAPAPEAAAADAPATKADTGSAGDDDPAKREPEVERFKLRCRNSGKLYGPFPFEDDAEVAIDRGAFALVKSEFGRAATFHLKSRKTDKMYGPFVCRYGSGVTLAARTFTIVRPETARSAVIARREQEVQPRPAATPEKDQSVVPRGGRFWSCAFKAKKGSHTFLPGARLSIWPAEDRVFSVKLRRRGSDYEGELPLKLKWVAPSSRPPLDNATREKLYVHIVYSTVQVSARVRSVRAEKGDREGELELVLPFFFGVEAEYLLLFLYAGEEMSDSPEPISNMLKLKMRITRD